MSAGRTRTWLPWAYLMSMQGAIALPKTRISNPGVGDLEGGDKVEGEFYSYAREGEDLHS